MLRFGIYVDLTSGLICLCKCIGAKWFFTATPRWRDYNESLLISKYFLSITLVRMNSSENYYMTRWNVRNAKRRVSIRRKSFRFLRIQGVLFVWGLQRKTRLVVVEDKCYLRNRVKFELSSMTALRRQLTDCALKYDGRKGAVILCLTTFKSVVLQLHEQGLLLVG